MHDVGGMMVILQWIKRYKEARIARYKQQMEEIISNSTLRKNIGFDEFIYEIRRNQDDVIVTKTDTHFVLTFRQVWWTEKSHSEMIYDVRHTQTLCVETIQKGHPLFQKVAREYRELRRRENEQIEQHMMDNFLTKKERLAALNEEIEQLSSEFRVKQEKWESCIEEIGFSTKKSFRLPQEAKLNELKEEKRVLQGELHQLKRRMQRYQPTL